MKLVKLICKISYENHPFGNHSCPLEKTYETDNTWRQSHNAHTVCCYILIKTIFSNYSSKPIIQLSLMLVGNSLNDLSWGRNFFVGNGNACDFLPLLWESYLQLIADRSSETSFYLIVRPKPWICMGSGHVCLFRRYWRQDWLHAMSHSSTHQGHLKHGSPENCPNVEECSLLQWDVATFLMTDENNPSKLCVSSPAKYNVRVICIITVYFKFVHRIHLNEHKHTPRSETICSTIVKSLFKQKFNLTIRERFYV